MAGKFVLIEDDEPNGQGAVFADQPTQAAAPPSQKFVLLDDHEPGLTAAEPSVSEMLAKSDAFDQMPLGQTRDIALHGEPGYMRTAAGAGKALSDGAHGLVQLAAEAGNFISDDLVSHDTVAKLRAETDETAARDATAMDDPAFRGGNLAGHVAMSVAMPARSIPTALASATAYGAVQPVGALDSRTENTLAGAGFGGLGAGVAGIIGRSLKPVRNLTAPGTQALIREAEENGYRFSAGQATGNRHVQNAEGAIDTLPMGGSHLRNLDDHNQSLTNRKVGREMGEDVDAVTPEVIEAARTRIGAVMDDPSHGRPFDVDRSFFDDIFRIRTEYGQTLRAEQSAQIRGVLDELAAGSGTRSPQITAAQYQRTASAYKQEAEAAFRSGANVGDARIKLDIAKALDRLADRNLTGEEKAAFREAQRQYSATLIAEKAVRNDNSGNIRIEALNAATKKHRRVAHRQGTEDELVKLARIGQHLKSVRIPNSGTAERSMWLRAAQSPWTLGAGGYAASGGDPYAAGGGVLLPVLLGRGMHSNVGQNWLRNGLPMPGRNHLIEAMSRTAPGVASGVSASETVD